MPFRRPPAVADAEDVAKLARMLQRLDPWSFWTVELGQDAGASFAVLGVTGSFVAQPCGLEGYLEVKGRKLVVNGRAVGGFDEVKRAAKALRGRLLDIGASTSEVTPLIVLTKAAAGRPREHGGVHVLRPEDVVPTITSRTRVLDKGTAELLARRLGRVLPGVVQRSVEEEE